MSDEPFTSLGTRLNAVDSNAMRLPSSEIEGTALLPSAWPPLAATLTRTVSPVIRSWRNTSREPLSPATRLLADEWKAI